MLSMLVDQIWAQWPTALCSEVHLSPVYTFWQTGCNDDSLVHQKLTDFAEGLKKCTIALKEVA